MADYLSRSDPANFPSDNPFEVVAQDPVGKQLEVDKRFAKTTVLENILELYKNTLSLRKKAFEMTEEVFIPVLKN